MRSDGKILIVDDEPFNIKLLASLLENDHELLFAADGPRALALVESARPDLILLDLMMPGMDGIEVCHALRQRPETRRIPVIFLTGRNDIGAILRRNELAGAAYIVKPYTVDQLVTRVRRELAQTAAAV